MVTLSTYSTVKCLLIRFSFAFVSLKLSRSLKYVMASSIFILLNVAGKGFYFLLRIRNIMYDLCWDKL